MIYREAEIDRWEAERERDRQREGVIDLDRQSLIEGYTEI